MLIQKEDLLNLYIDKKMSPKEISFIYSCDPKTVSNYLRRYGIPVRSASETADIRLGLTIDMILERVEKGMLIQDICEEFGVSRACIGRITRKHGYNFANNKNAIAKQKEFLKTNNPIKKGEKRDRSIVEKSNAIKRANYNKKLFALDYENIPFHVYGAYARKYAYSHVYGKNVGENMHIDHIYSVRDGYENKVPIPIISNKCNLRIIPKKDNLSKGHKSLITLNELYEMVDVQRLLKTQLNVGSE